MISFSLKVLMGLRERMMEALATLGLYGMKSTFDEIMAVGIKSRATPENIFWRPCRRGIGGTQGQKHPLSDGLGEVPC